MYFRLKISKEDNNGKTVKETYLTEAEHFAEAAQKVISVIGTNPEVEEIKLMKNFKPSINENMNPDLNKLYMVKIAEDIVLDNGNKKTIKYDLPAFAINSNELQTIVNDYISQGLNDMRLTTISETKWIWV